MAEIEDAADAALRVEAARLEAALERIADRAHKLGAHVAPTESDNAGTAQISARLDALIVQLRAALGASGP